LRFFVGGYIDDGALIVFRAYGVGQGSNGVYGFPVPAYDAPYVFGMDGDEVVDDAAIFYLHDVNFVGMANEPTDNVVDEVFYIIDHGSSG
jgi:hypothetical protein